MTDDQTKEPQDEVLHQGGRYPELEPWYATYRERKPRLDVYVSHALIQPRDEGETPHG